MLSMSLIEGMIDELDDKIPQEYRKYQKLILG